jgi:DNA-binding transcriptional LysR family regulator
VDRLFNMQVFVRVSETLNFTKAAESLGLPKATISNCIHQLESHLKVRLFYRTTRKVELTQDGLIYYEKCKDLLSDFEEVDSLFLDETNDLAGRIRVDMGVQIARNVVMPRLPEFLNKHPGISIEFSCTDRLVDIVREGFDCVLRVGLLKDSDLIARPLGQLRILNLASPKYLETHGKPKNLESLKNHFLIHYTTTLGSKPFGFEYLEGDKYKTIQMKGNITVNNTDAYKAACLAGFGIIQAPAVSTVEYLKSGELVEILPKLKAEPLPISLIYPHRRNLAKRVQRFMDWLEVVVKEYAIG